MEISDIFVDENTGEGLYSIIYDGQEENEFDRILRIWSDPGYVALYCWQNEKYIVGASYFKGYLIDDVISLIEREAIEIDRILIQLTKEGFEGSGNGLQELFRPLSNKESSLYLHQKSKAKIDDKRNFPKTVLRMYAIRVSNNTFVITGGVIKLVHELKDHPDTLEETRKLEKVRSFLKDNDINSEEDLKLLL